MNNLLNKFLNREKAKPQKPVLISFKSQFKSAKNIDWTVTENYSEAIFFIQEQEYIARFSPDGKILEYKINLPLTAIPENIKETACQHGEIMNLIETNKSDLQKEYEIIVRNKDLERFQLVLTKDGNQIKKEKM
jgi:hypothetical protein